MVCGLWRIGKGEAFHGLLCKILSVKEQSLKSGSFDNIMLRVLCTEGLLKGKIHSSIYYMDSSLASQIPFSFFSEAKHHRIHLQKIRCPRCKAVEADGVSSMSAP